MVWNFEIGWPKARRSRAEAPRAHPDAHRRDADPADVKNAQELTQASTAGPEQVLLRHTAIGEGQRARVRGVPAHLPVGRSRLVPGGAVGYEQVGDLTSLATAPGE